MNRNTSSTRAPDWTVFGKGYDKVASFKGKIENFADALRGKEELFIKPEDALASVHVIEAAYKSLNQNLWQPVVEKALRPINYIFLAKYAKGRKIRIFSLLSLFSRIARHKILWQEFIQQQLSKKT